ncbi:MAG: metallophosphoesterase [Ruminococcaceae bacterium]|nr:metallophosphoesterase [Oscillospiraceae bacterium]
MTKKKIKTLSVVSAIVILLAVLCGWVVWGNLTLDVTEYTAESNLLPKSFSGYTIAHVSDLHNAEKGENNEKLISALEEAKPDMIAITGDLVDSRHTDIEVAMEFAKQAVKIAPCYYVTGNHEGRLPNYDSIKNELVEIGVNVMDNSKLEIKKDGQKITLLGIEDPRMVSVFEEHYARITNYNLNNIAHDVSGYTILLAHRPELFDTYKAFDINLVLCGHAHGGQVRVPFLGGVLVPNQGFFPEYDAGKFTERKTTMIISRGIGNSVVPVRVNNNPELVIVKLEYGTDTEAEQYLTTVQ